MSENIFTYSNNSNGFMSANVNERNGCFNFSLHLVDIKANNLKGPTLSLSLGFDQNSKDDYGFGPALMPSLPYIDVVNHLFANDKGVVIKLDSTNNRSAEPCLLDFQFFRTGSSDFKVVYNDGTTDFYSKRSPQSNRAVLIRRESSTSESIKFEWGVADKLKKIYDDVGNEFLNINLAGDKYNREIALYGGRRFIYTSSNLDKHSITLPYEISGQWGNVEEFTIKRTLDSTAKSYYLINSVTMPDGSMHELTYTRLKLPSGAQYSSLPAVSIHKLTQNGVDVSLCMYKYGSSDDDTGDNNAYGLNSVTSIETYSDPLYSLRGEYFYTVEKKERDHLSNERVTVCKYDKFHNLIFSKSSYKGGVIVDLLNYNSDYTTDVSEQGRTFKLVKLHSKKYISGATEFEESYSYSYDDYGNLLKEIDHLKGIRIDYEYYDTLNGEVPGLCPEFKFICFMKSQTVTDLKNGESRVVSSRKYERIDPIKPLLIHLVEDANLYSGVVTKYSYDRMGRQCSITIDNSGASRTDEFVYSEIDNSVSIQVLTSANDEYTDKIQEQHVYNCLTGQLIEYCEHGTRINYTYYPDGRLMTEVVAKGTEYCCERHYQYNDKENAVVMTDHAGNQKRIEFNPLGKALKIFLTIPGVVNDFLSEEFFYNTLGQCYHSIYYDAVIGEGDGQTWRLNTNYEYSEWGEVARTFKPDGQVEFDFNDPIAQISTKGVEGLFCEERIVDWGGRSITINKRNCDGSLMSSDILSHNGFSETISSINDKGVRTDYELDKLSRISRKTTSFLTDGSAFKIQHDTSYSSFDLTGEHREIIKINGIQIGQRHYDGHGRLRAEVIGNDKTTFDYPEGSIFYNRIRNNDHEVIDAIYNPFLGSYTTLGNSTKVYHPRTGAVLLAERSDLEGAIAFEYRFDGLLSRETSVHGDNIHEYTLKGLPLKSQYCDGTSKVMIYDSLQRLAKVTDGINSMTYEVYDALSRPLKICSVGENNFEINYDYSGLPFTETVVTKSDENVFIEKYTYARDGRVNKKELSLNGDILSEFYNYDPLGRLVTYLARGNRAPTDIHGNIISKQEITYDDYGNISKSIMTFVDGAHNIEYFKYDNVNPTKLVMIENSNLDYGVYDFSQQYDNNNNLLSDESGNLYSYNIHGELKEVRDSNGLLLCSYDYDALGRIIYQRVGNQPIVEYKFNGEDLLSLEQAGASTHFSYLGGKPIGKACRKNGSVDHHNYLTDKSNTLVRVSHNKLEGCCVDYLYTAYGNQKVFNSVLS
ncbi:RHS repeat domain-containing protein [Aeromonas veronii]